MKHIPSSSQPSPPLPSPSRLPWAPHRSNFLSSLTPTTTSLTSPAPPPTSAGAAPPPLPPSSPSSRSLHSPLASSATITLVVCGSILGTASPATPPATPLLSTATLSSPAHLTPSSMAPAPLSVSSCWRHSPSPIGLSPTSRLVAPSFSNVNRLASLDSAAALPPSRHRWGSSAYPHSFADGFSSSTTDLLRPTTQTKKGTATAGARRCLPCHHCNPCSRWLCLGIIILLQSPLLITPAAVVVSSPCC
ncbi:hypothetical protein BHM03_00029932 [Ensete ventricosum]|nr:hypothetical protein BHM03_00029932 [Ensete ventricosum]